MRIFVSAMIILLNIVLESTVFQAIKIRGVLPNTTIIIIISFALLRGSSEGAIIGFFCGLLHDMFFGTSVGFHACLGMLTGYFAGKPQKTFYKENYLLPLFLSSIFVIAYELIIYCVGFLSRGNLNIFYYLMNLIIPEAVYTAVVSIFLYRLLYGINDLLEEKERYRRRLF